MVTDNTIILIALKPNPDHRLIGSILQSQRKLSLTLRSARLLSNSCISLYCTAIAVPPFGEQFFQLLYQNIPQQSTSIGEQFREILFNISPQSCKYTLKDAITLWQEIKRAQSTFSFCRFEPRALKPKPDFWCGCPQPGVLKIGKFPFEKNYSNAPKSRQALKSLISCGIRRFFILIFTNEKEHKIGSKKRQKCKKSGSENFHQIERTLENTGFSRVPLAERKGFEPLCAFAQTDFECHRFPILCGIL